MYYFISKHLLCITHMHANKLITNLNEMNKKEENNLESNLKNKNYSQQALENSIKTNVKGAMTASASADS